MNGALSFAIKSNNNRSTRNSFAEIAREDEKKKL